MSDSIYTLTLNEGREKSLLRRHPWIFSKALSAIPSDLSSGDCVKVVSCQGEFLCYGLVSPKSQITVRAISFDENIKITDELIANRIRQAVSLRKNVFYRGNDGVRLVSSEGDLLPGLIADK